RDGTPIEGATSARFSIANARFEDAGKYTVKVTSPFGEVTSAEAELVVNPAGFEILIETAVVLSWFESLGEVILEGANDPAGAWVEIPFDARKVEDRREVTVKTLERFKFYRLRPVSGP
ncbi:MAG: hypothetical protein KIT22_17390, partial [Verrucomicrobiae bacterium]|nr:hypothetical protein [Verrucomicrobiae bacterium]